MDKVQKSSKTNGELLQGVGYIDDIKVKLEAACPLTVSCADILSFAAMEAMTLLGGPRCPYLGGRRDGMVSLASQVDIDRNIPLPEWTVDQIIQLSHKKGFSVENMVVLSGDHSAGVAHCSVFKDRIVGYGGSPKPNVPNQLVTGPAMKRKPPGTTEARAYPTVSFEETPTVLDNMFFRNLVEQKKALLASDQNLLNDPRTSPYVHQFAGDEQLFKNKFADALVRMSSLDVLIGKSGEIRRTCKLTN
ncbi:peroxidase 5-like [Prosopis cineraria]|uniref:peroxidase 5-like n=1 Tax=Prosopis cineraria TaxID=364024 RepID=UPI00240F1D45|nr:peroxidase 5-like [Prosopis cineraria]